MAVLIVASIGCGKKQEDQKAETKTEVQKVRGGYLLDPVDKASVDLVNSKYSYVYKEIEYKFNSKENMEAFMKDPEKYLKKQ
ncbi:MAG: YHS domain-containing protein [Candidatus Krumholzibacteriota bacterium]|nr:YHS domain-containing protein [Candidatus Krumholzibacteriota bacterium]